MSFGLGPVVTQLAFDPITVTRAAGAYTSGVWVAGLPSTFDAVASITPLKGRELARLPEGRRENGAVQAFLIVELRNGDRFTWSSATYEVDVVEDWSTYGYWRVLAARVQTP